MAIISLEDFVYGHKQQVEHIELRNAKSFCGVLQSSSGEGIQEWDLSDKDYSIHFMGMWGNYHLFIKIGNNSGTPSSHIGTGHFLQHETCLISTNDVVSIAIKHSSNSLEFP